MGGNELGARKYSAWGRCVAFVLLLLSFPFHQVMEPATVVCLVGTPCTRGRLSRTLSRLQVRCCMHTCQLHWFASQLRS